MIKAIIFDCFGVLTIDRWLEFCAGITDKDIREEARSLNYLYDSGQMPLDEFLHELQELTGEDHQKLKNIFVNPAAAKNDQLLDYIKQLKPHYKIGILSNVASNWIRDSFLTDKEQALFDTMVFSYEIGAGKPDPEAYNTVLNNLNVGPEEAVLIDDLERYCDGAEAVGMHALQYENFEKMKTQLEKILAQR
jgi:putative hydrolase of the HAD superfamily